MHPNFLQCERPFWRGDDFTLCIRRDLIQVLLPSLVTGLSALWLTTSLMYRFIAKTRSRKYKRLPTHQNAAGGRSSEPMDDDDDGDDDDDEFAENLSLGRTISHNTFISTEVVVPREEVIRAACEILGILGVLGTFTAGIVMRHGNVGNNVGMPLVWGVVCWGYILVLATLRLWLSGSRAYDSLSLWDHTALLYMFNFIFATVEFRTALIQPGIGVSESLTIARFALVTLLCLIALSSRRGNKPVELKVIDGLEPSQEPLASLFSLATFSWVDGIVWKGYWKPFVLEEVWNLREDDMAYSVLSTFRQTKKATTLAITLLKHFRRDLVIQSLWAVFASAFTFAPTLLLRVILQYIQSPEDTPKSVAWLFVALLFVAASASAVGNAQALYIGRRICICLRAVIIGEVYAKALRRKVAAGTDKELGNVGKKKKADGKKPVETDDTSDKSENSGDQANVGAIINLMAVDSFKVADVCSYLHFLIAAVPVQVVIAVTLLYQILGWSSIAGIGVMILLLPLNYYISSQFRNIQQAIMATTDKRIHTTNEVLQNIRIIKFFAWEERFGQVVDESRTAELKNLRKRYILWAVAATSWYGSPIIITFLSFFSYTVIEKKDLNAPIAFTALSLFNVLRIPLDQLADMITNVLQTKVSIDRVEEFLNEEDTEKYLQLRPVRDEDSSAPLIGFKNAAFMWGSKKQIKSNGIASAFQLQDLDITFEPEALNIIAGPTGSGKTSLLMALLGEMTCLKGSVHSPSAYSREDLTPDAETGLTESVAYCAQQAWLVNDTIKNNILFASPYNEERYNAVLIACSLERDLQILDNGDETEVGEKGITLSGGQKQRISLARALYSSSKHLLLDDCLSAVDSHTARWIYDYCIMGPLMHARTCILVTHNVALCVPLARHVVVLDNGRVLMQGDPETVVASGALGNDELLKSGVKSRPVSRMPSRVPSYLGTPTNRSINEDRISRSKAHNGLIDLTGNRKGKKSEEETKTEGSVDWKVYRLYLGEMGPWWYWAIVLSIFGVQQMGTVATSVWIRQWVLQYEPETREEGLTMSGFHNTISSLFGYAGGYFVSGSWMWDFPMIASPNPVGIAKAGNKVDIWYYLGGYVLIGFVYTCMSFIREAAVFYGSLRASKRIHEQLLYHIMRARFRFFDSTPLGRIINRFSKDIETIDQEVAPVALGMVHSLASVIVIVILISVITPGFLVAGVMITLLYWLIGAFYLRASRDLKRLESIQRSPLYQHFGETLTGVSTIRAYGDERRFVRDNLDKVNTHNRPFFFLWACNRWLGFRVDIAGALVSFFAGAFVVSSVGKIDAGLAGLSLTYAITFTDNVLWVVRLYAMNEQNMNSVERIREYLEVEQEAAEIIPENRPPADWPERGAVTFSDYSTRYRPDLDRVLKNVSFEIKPFEKVGIVGRTGAGKSSLALALFRGLEAETGKIIIDGVDISKIGLRDLRQSITMVPQDPTLFTGTIRSNLDPFGVYTDGEIFGALKRVQLINEVPEVAAPVAGDDATVNKNIFLDLQSPVAESGNNLSQGQKQLLCLARALVREPKVLLMDEATASIDYTTDAKIQATIRELQNTTITIAHRLNSVIYYDKVLVLEHGEVREYDHPHNLLKNQDSLFREMCELSGELAQLEDMAKKAYMGTGTLVETAEDEETAS